MKRNVVTDETVPDREMLATIAKLAEHGFRCCVTVEGKDAVLYQIFHRAQSAAGRDMTLTDMDRINGLSTEELEGG